MVRAGCRRSYAKNTRKVATGGKLIADRRWLRVLVGVRGLEPPAPASQTPCATNCATPRRTFNYSQPAPEGQGLSRNGADRPLGTEEPEGFGGVSGEVTAVFRETLETAWADAHPLVMADSATTAETCAGDSRAL